MSTPDALSTLFSPIKIDIPPGPPPCDSKNKLKQCQVVGSLFGSPAPLSKACAICGRPPKCKCVQRSAPVPAQKEVWHLDVDAWQAKHSKPSSSDLFSSRDKSDLRRWFEGLGQYGKGGIPSDALLAHLIAGNVIGDEQGLREALHTPVGEIPRIMSFCNFLTLVEKSKDALFVWQLKRLVAQVQSSSNELCLSLRLSQDRRKKLLDHMIDGAAPSCVDDLEHDQGQAAAADSSATERRMPARRRARGQKSAEEFLESVSRVIEDDKSALSLARQAKNHPVQSKPPVNTSATDVASDLQNAFPGHTNGWQHQHQHQQRKEHNGDALAQTMSRVPVPVLALSPSRRPGLQKQRSFDQLVLTEQRSFDELHVQREQCFGPRASFCVRAVTDDDINDEIDDIDDDICSHLDRQILEKTLQAGSSDLAVLRGGPLPDILLSPVKCRRRQPGTGAAEHDHLLPTLPPPPPPWRRRQLQEREQTQAQAQAQAQGVPPFTPMDLPLARQRQQELKLQSLVTPQERRARLIKLQQQAQLDHKISGRRGQQAQGQWQGQGQHRGQAQHLVLPVSTHSFQSLSNQPQALQPEDFGTLYDFVQKM